MTTPTHPDLLAHVEVLRKIQNSFPAGGRAEAALDAAIDSLAAQRVEAVPHAWLLNGRIYYSFDRAQAQWQPSNIMPDNTIVPVYTNPPEEVLKDAHPPQAQAGAGEGVDEAAVLEALRLHIKEHPSQQAFAREYNVSPQYVSDVLAGRRYVPETWVSVLGYRKVGWVREPLIAAIGEASHDPE